MEFMTREFGGIMKTLTIIVPVYNGAEYIERCLKSILGQRYEGLGLIVVDDGSTDNSRQVIEKAVKKYNRYEYPVTVRTQANAGVAAARNLGVRLANSDYIAFADQDDWLKKGFAEAFMKYVEDEDRDMVIGGFCRKDAAGRMTKKMVPDETEWARFCLTYPWGRIIRRNFLLENNISFLKTGIGEDVYFDLVAYSYSDNIITVRNCLYVWYDNPVSVSNVKYTTLNEKTNPLYTFDCILRDIDDEDYISSDFLEYYFLKFTIWYLLTNVRGSGKEDILKMRKVMFTWLRKHYPQYENNRYISPFKPRGDKLLNRLCVWGYMLLHRVRADGWLLGVLAGEKAR